MSSAALAIRKQQEQRHRHLVLSSLLGSQDPLAKSGGKASSDFPDKTQHGQEPPKSQRQRQTGAGVASSPSHLCPSQQKARAALFRLYPTAMTLAGHRPGRGRGRGGGHGGSPAGLGRAWYKPLPLGPPKPRPPGPPAPVPVPVPDASTSGRALMPPPISTVGSGATVTLRGSTTARRDEPSSCGAPLTTSNLAAGPSLTQMAAAEGQPTESNQASDWDQQVPCGNPECFKCLGAREPSELYDPEAATTSSPTSTGPAAGPSAVSSGRQTGPSTPASALQAEPTEQRAVRDAAYRAGMQDLVRVSSALHTVAAELGLPTAGEAAVCPDIARLCDIFAEDRRNALDLVASAGPSWHAMLQPYLQYAEVFIEDTMRKAEAAACSVAEGIGKQAWLRRAWWRAWHGEDTALGMLDTLDACTAGKRGASDGGYVGRGRWLFCEAVGPEYRDLWARLVDNVDHGPDFDLVLRRALCGLILLEFCRDDLDVDPMACVVMCSIFRFTQDALAFRRVLSPSQIYVMVLVSGLPFSWLLPRVRRRLAPETEEGHYDPLFDFFDATGTETFGLYTSSNLWRVAMCAILEPWRWLAHYDYFDLLSFTLEGRAGDAQVDLHDDLLRLVAIERGAGQALREWPLPDREWRLVPPVPDPVLGGDAAAAAATAAATTGAAPAGDGAAAMWEAAFMARICPRGPEPVSQGQGNLGVCAGVRGQAWRLWRTLLHLQSLSEGPVDALDRLRVRLESAEVAAVLLMWMVSESRFVKKGLLLFQPTCSAGESGGGGSPTRGSLPASAGTSSTAVQTEEGRAAGKTAEDEELSDMMVYRGSSMPGREHTGYDWREIRERIHLMSATSNASHQVKIVREGMVKKRLMFMWLQGQGVEGVRRVLQAVAQIRADMHAAGWDLCVVPITVKTFGDGDGDASPEFRSAGRRGPPAQGSRDRRGPACQGEELQAGNEPGRDESECSCRIRDLFAQLSARVKGALDRHKAECAAAPPALPSSHLARRAAEEREAVEALVELLELLRQNTCQGFVCEVVLLECTPQRPTSIVVPEAGQVLSQQEREQAARRKKKQLADLMFK